MSNATELLRRAQEFLKYPLLHVSDNLVWPRQDLFQDIENFLAVEKEAEPFAWVDEGRLKARQQGFSAIAVWFNPDEGDIPVYLHPPRPEPARKPMTEEEINKEFVGNKKYEQTGDALFNFFKGVRFAEKHHGIGGDDE